MGTVAIQTQCCLLKMDDDWETDDEAGSAQEGTAVQLVDPMPWHGRPGGGFLARLIAHRPRCPGPLVKQQPLSRLEECEWQERPVQISEGVKLRL